MFRLFNTLILASSALLAFAGAAAPTDDELRKKPITTASGELGDLLRKWYKEGTAAGNVGDWYDNRDGEHSPLDLRPWPQLQKVKYTEADLKAKRNWALAKVTRPFVVFGNSSTSAPPTLSGSNVRTYYCNPQNLAFLYQHYTHNNLYIYPEHRDHDPGHNGRGDGFGDLYPTNTPYLLTSQGSSGSDQPFMRALPFTLAAFRPEVKKKLVESGLLMPTVQMILRSSNNHLKAPGDYLTGKAHPTVFEGHHVDPLKMVKTAHAIRRENIPPMVQLKVVKESEPVPGRDYFGPAVAPMWLTEKLADTPAVVARVWRGKDQQRTLLVSAEGSYDVNKRPLTYRWVVLRGDEKKITIKPRNKAGSVVEVVVGYHPRRPIAPGSPMESNRVDIGVFVHNGAHYSAPGFLTFFSLDSESRTYDDKGRILEIGHGMGVPTLLVSDPGALLLAVAAEGPAARCLKIAPERMAKLRKQAGPYGEKRTSVLRKSKELEGKHRDTVTALRASEARILSLRKANARRSTNETKAAVDAEVRRAQRLRDDLKAREPELRAEQKKAKAALDALDKATLEKNLAVLGASPRLFLDRAVRAAQGDIHFGKANAATLNALLESAPNQRRASVAAAAQRLVELGVSGKVKGAVLDLRPIRTGPAPLAERLTPYERALVDHFHATLLSEVLFPGALTSHFDENFVDGRLTARKRWRDVYRYDADGALLGWARYDAGKISEFTADGLVVLEKDARGRPIKARTVRYELPRPYPLFAGDRKPLAQVLGDEVVTYTYDGDRRREKNREKVKDSKEDHPK